MRCWYFGDHGEAAVNIRTFIDCFLSIKQLFDPIWCAAGTLVTAGDYSEC